MKVGSLCSGYSGLELGLSDLFDVDLAWVSDIDKGANKILACRHPDVPNLGDFTTATDVEPVDVLCAGFPCQPVSHAGKRAGTDDERWLFDDITRLVGLLDPRPRLLVFENVLGLLSANRGHAMARVVHGLAQIGYVGRWRTLRAADVGAPHRRERVFITAHPRGEAERFWPGLRAGEPGWLGRGRPDDDGSPSLLPTPRATDGTKGGPNQRGSSGDLMLPSAVMELLPTPRATRGGSATETVELLPTPRATDPAGEMSRSSDGFRPQLGEVARLLPTPTAQDSAASGGSTPSDVTLTDAVIRTDLGRADNPRHLLPTPTTEPTTGNGHARNLGAETRLLPTPRAAQYIDTPERFHARQQALMTSADSPHCASGIPLNTAVLELDRWGDYAPAIARWETVIGRPAPAPTETGPKGSPRLSPRFVEWVMGLPAGWVTDVPGLTRNEQLKALGNGVVPQQAAAAVGWLLGETRERVSA